MAAFKEALEGVAGDSEVLGRSTPANPPQAGAHIVPDGVDELAVNQRRIPRPSISR